MDTKDKNSKEKTILIIDDEAGVRRLLTKKLEKEGYSILESENGVDGLRIIQKKIPDLVITDIHMPIMDGYRLLDEINRLMLPVPVIIITGLSDANDVIKSLRLGVKDFIRKPFETMEMLKTIEKILTSPEKKTTIDNILPFIELDSKILAIPNDMRMVNLAAFYLTRDLTDRGLCNYVEKENLRHALEETLTNAMIHGNLEMSSELKAIGSVANTAFNALLEERKKTEPYCSRTIKIKNEITKEKIEYTIEDEGPGFDHEILPDPLHPDNFFKPYGRGLFFIRLHVDDVKWNDKGNIITISKNKGSSAL